MRSPDPEQRPAHSDAERRCAAPEALPWAEALAALGTGAMESRAGSLTCWAALSASSANSTERPFSACLRDPHVLLCRAAQEGSGVVSDPKALGRRNTRERGHSRPRSGPDPDLTAPRTVCGETRHPLKKASRPPDLLKQLFPTRPHPAALSQQV